MTSGKHVRGKCPCYIIMTAMQLISVCTKTRKLLQVTGVDRSQMLCAKFTFCSSQRLRFAHLQLTKLSSAFNVFLKVQFDGTCP